MQLLFAVVCETELKGGRCGAAGAIIRHIYAV